jgi:PilZ domain
MALSDDNPDIRTQDQRLSKFVDKLTLDDQRALSRLLNSWDERDQRKYPREKCSIITGFTVDNHNYKGIIRDISPYGAYIKSRHQFPVNLVISQSFFFPNFEIPIRSSSNIVWVGSDGFGVKFDSLGSDE